MKMRRMIEEKVDYRKYYTIMLENWYNSDSAWRIDTLRAGLKTSIDETIESLQNYYDCVWPEQEVVISQKVWWKNNGEGRLIIEKTWTDERSGMRLVKRTPIKVCRWTKKDATERIETSIPISKDYKKSVMRKIWEESKKEVKA